MSIVSLRQTAPIITAVCRHTIVALLVYSFTFVHLCSYMLNWHVELYVVTTKTAMRHMNTSHRITTHNPPILYRPTGSTRHTEPTVRSIAMHPRSLVAPSFTKMSRNLNFFRRFESTKATRRRREACCSTCKIVA